MFPISREPFTKRLTPSEIQDMVAYIKQHRASEAPFEVAYTGRTSGSDAAADAAIVTPYAEAGLTWWVESIRLSSLAAVRERIRKGPPRVEESSGGDEVNSCSTLSLA